MNTRLNIQRAQKQMAQIVSGWTAQGTSPLDGCPNDKEFIDHYKLKIDGRPFDWKAYEHMIEVYEDDHPMMVFMAGAQTGKTARLLAKLARAGVIRWGASLGFYFPTKELPKEFSEGRFRPFMHSSKELGTWLGRTTSEGQGVDRKFKRTLGPTQFLFRSTEGKTSTESTPMQGTFFDEVRRMPAGNVQRAMERYSAQKDPIDVKVSTARYPGMDIDFYFQQGDQRYFHTYCNCSDGTILSKTFPDCVADLKKVDASFMKKVQHAFRHDPRGYLGMTDRERAQFGDAVYHCPKCGMIIVNPRDGWWQPHNEGAYIHSYQMPQLLSDTYPAARAIKKWEESPDLQEVYNSMLGLAHVNAEAQPVLQDHLEACVNPRARWTANMSPRWRRKHMRNCAMGIDAMGGYNCIIIKKLTSSGKHRTVHIEVSHGDDPWKRCRELMQLYDVRICVSDANPHWNEALRFAKDFRGRVWLASYVDQSGTQGKTPMVSWKDLTKAKDQKGEETRFKFRVNINRTNGLKWSLKRWGRGANETPDPNRLIQSLPKQRGRVMLTPGLSVGRFEDTRICRDLYWLHQQRVAFVKKYANDDAKRRQEFKIVAEHIAIDPHFAHSNLYADVALQRIGRPRLPNFGDDDDE